MSSQQSLTAFSETQAESTADDSTATEQADSLPNQSEWDGDVLPASAHSAATINWPHAATRLDHLSELPEADADASESAAILDAFADHSVSPLLPVGRQRLAGATFVHVAGSGGMGGGELVNSPAAIETVLQAHVGWPVALAGGGGSISNRPPLKVGVLVGVDTDADPVRPVIEHVRRSRRYRLREMTPKLGSWKVYVPWRVEDAVVVARTLQAFTTGAVSPRTSGRDITK